MNWIHKLIKRQNIKWLIKHQENEASIHRQVMIACYDDGKREAAKMSMQEMRTAELNIKRLLKQLEEL